MSLKRLSRWIATALSTLIMLEVLIMISPFAFYWYTFYSPTLQKLHASQWTAWLESFFLPHAAISTSSFLETLRWTIGPYMFSLGLLGFLALAAQIYSSKLLKKGMVQGGVYRYIRHPQYLCLAVAGFGLITHWPRMIILVFYLLMLISYYLLARSEEIRMLKDYPGYADYMRNSVMFLPGNPGKHLRDLLFGWVTNRKLSTALCCLTGFAVGIGIGLALREYSIGHLARAPLPHERVLAVAIWPQDASRTDIAGVTHAVLADPEIAAQIQKEGQASYFAHLLPGDYGMVNMFANVGQRTMTPEFTTDRFAYLVRYAFPFFGDNPRYRPMGHPGQPKYKLILSRVDKPGDNALPLDRIMDMNAKMTPIVMVDVDSTGKILKRDDPGRRSVWGPITMPIF